MLLLSDGSLKHDMYEWSKEGFDLFKAFFTSTSVVKYEREKIKDLLTCICAQGNLSYQLYFTGLAKDYGQFSGSECGLEATFETLAFTQLHPNGPGGGSWWGGEK